MGRGRGLVMSGVENQSGGPRGLGSSEGRHRRNAEERWERIYQLRTQDRLGFRTAVYYPTDAVRRARYSAAPFIHSPVPSVARHGGQPPRNSRSRKPTVAQVPRIRSYRRRPTEQPAIHQQAKTNPTKPPPPAKQQPLRQPATSQRTVPTTQGEREFPSMGERGWEKRL